MVSNQKIETAKELLIKRLDPAFILLFGSHAQNTANDESDFDIAYFSKKSLSNYERFQLAGELASIVNVDVDLVDIREADTVFASLIFSTGKQLYCTDENLFYLERMKALSMYVALNEQRAEVLHSIKKRGTVYEQ